MKNKVSFLLPSLRFHNHPTTNRCYTVVFHNTIDKHV